jgi:hypothetical protein
VGQRLTSEKPIGDEANRVQGDGKDMTIDDTPKKKSITLGVVLAVGALCWLALAAVIYPVWQDNKEILLVKEVFGDDTPGDHLVVAIQTVVVLGGFVAGGPFLAIGLVLIALATIYNSRLDAVYLQHKLASEDRAPATPSAERAFCPYCGQPTEGKPFCAFCGKKTSP